MTYPKNRTPEAIRRKHMSDKKYENNLAERIRIKQLYLDELADPEYYNEIERRLRKVLPGLTLTIAPNDTIARWRGEDGTTFVRRGYTRGDVLLQLWQTELPPEF